MRPGRAVSAFRESWSAPDRENSPAAHLSTGGNFIREQFQSRARDSSAGRITSRGGRRGMGEAALPYELNPREAKDREIITAPSSLPRDFRVNQKLRSLG